MRHRNKINSLGRKAAHRKKTLSSLATALIMNKRINTTVAKAKALRVYVEPLITKSKEDSTHSRRVVFSYLRDKYAVSELFREVSQKVADRPGGYTRILKTGFRKGDGAEMCFIELVDYNTHMLQTEEDTQQKRTRRGRRRGKKSGEETAAESQAPQKPAPKEQPVKEEQEEQVTTDEVKTEAPEAEVKEQPQAEEQPEATAEEKPAQEEVKKEEPVAEKKEPVAEKEESAEPEADTPDQKEEEKADPKKEDKQEEK